MTKLNNPKVIKLSGKASNLSSQPIKILMILKTTATVIAVPKFLILILGSTWATIKIAALNSSTFKIIVKIHIVTLLLIGFIIPFHIQIIQVWKEK
jgi:hypothetical protein